MSKHTKFFDLYSGGRRKTEFDCIVIEGDEETARDIFTTRFGRDPDNVTCRCCGRDFSVSEFDSREEATAYEDKHDEPYIVYSKD